MNPLTALKLTKVEITGWAVEDGKKGTKIGSMKLQVNPNSISHKFGEKEKEDEDHSKYKQGNTAAGSPATTTDAYKAKTESFSFKFTLDATGVLDGCDDVKKSLKKFKDIAFYYNGEGHDRPIVNVVWGGIFKSGKNGGTVDLQVNSLSINYTLFKPSGKPLRADVDVSFEEFIPPKKALLLAKPKSPDMTHTRTVGMGDTLPAMCKRIYGNPRYYLEVARYNNLNSTLNLKPGQELFFPPLEK